MCESRFNAIAPVPVPVACFRKLVLGQQWFGSAIAIAIANADPHAGDRPPVVSR